MKATKEAVAGFAALSPRGEGKRRALAAAVFAAASAAAAWGGPLDDLLPKPRSVAVAEGFLVDGAAKARVVRGVVASAPPSVADQAYVLKVSPDGVTVTAGGERGERYALATLAQLSAMSGGRVPCCEIRDWPELRWRGAMNDCGRNFLAVEGVKAMLDVMAKYKYNLFHWHLADYHGWRLESKRYPQLQRKEAFRRQVGKYYTQDEFREVVRYAGERGITVMPEIDLPGHSLAFRVGMGISEMDSSGIDDAVCDIIDELCSLAPADVMPFIHLGTDEVRIPPEFVPRDWCTKWATRIAQNGRKTVRWAPGRPMTSPGEVIDMVWYDSHVTNSTFRAFDSARMYFASTDPFMMLNITAFPKPCRWEVDPARKLGAIACSWHDDNVGDDTLRLFHDVVMFPALVGFADNYWSGRAEDHGELLNRMPAVGTPEFELAEDLERRIVAQRDTVLKDLPHPFSFVRQTQMRWRLTDARTGRVLAKDVAQGTIDVSAYVDDASEGLVVAETWVRSGREREVGAWVNFTGFGTAYVRCHDMTLPGRGEWNKMGAKAEVNGVAVPPPEWMRPDERRTSEFDQYGTTYRGVCWSCDLCETPFADEEVTLRPPVRVRLRKGWNHVKLTMPKRKWLGVATPNWVGTFCFVDGTTEHPREVEGLEYSSEERE